MCSLLSLSKRNHFYSARISLKACIIAVFEATIF